MTPEQRKDESKALREQWVNSHVERWVEQVRSDRLRQVFSDDAEPGQSDAAVVREDLRKAFSKQLEQPLPVELPYILQELHDLRESSLERVSADDPEYESERNKFIDEWNSHWKQLTGNGGDQLPPSLKDIRFQLWDLPRINLTNADLQSDGSSIEQHANHRGVRLPGARLVNANLCKVDLASACLDGADLTGAHLRGASLVGAKLRGAVLEGADLRGALLGGADLTGAKLTHARFDGADLANAILDDANLEFATGILYDANSIWRTKFGKRPSLFVRGTFLYALILQWLMRRYIAEHHRIRALPRPDLWTSLRNAYTGPNFFISLLFLVAFALPYVAQSVLLTQIGRGEGALMGVVVAMTGADLDRPALTPDERKALRAQVRTEFTTLRQAFVETARSARDAAAASSRAANEATGVSADARASLVQAADAMTELEARMTNFRGDVGRLVTDAVAERRYPVWKIVLGIDTGDLGWTLLVSLLIIYNLLRWFLTTNVAPLRDAEERSHVTPARADYLMFGPLHRAVEWLFWLSTISGAYVFFRLMTTPVYKFW